MPVRDTKYRVPGTNTWTQRLLPQVYPLLPGVGGPVVSLFVGNANNTGLGAGPTVPSVKFPYMARNSAWMPLTSGAKALKLKSSEVIAMMISFRNLALSAG